MVVYNFIKQDRVVVETYWNLLSLKNENCFKYYSICSEKFPWKIVLKLFPLPFFKEKKIV